MSRRSSGKRKSTHKRLGSRKNPFNSLKPTVLKTTREIKNLQEFKLEIKWPRYIKDSRIKTLNTEFTSKNIYELTKEYNRNTFISKKHKTNVSVIDNMFVKYDTLYFSITKFGILKKLNTILSEMWTRDLKNKKIHSFLGSAPHRPTKLKTKKNKNGRNVINQLSMINESVFIYPNVKHSNNNQTIKSLNLNKPIKFKSTIPKLDITIELTKN